MKNRRLFKFFTGALSALMLAGLLAGCGGGSSSGVGSAGGDASGGGAAAGGEEPYHITMAVLGVEQEDDAKVLAAINELTLAELNMTFDLITLSWGEYMQKLNLMLSGGDALDILPVYNQLATNYIAAGQLVNLFDYIYDYGQGILENVGEDVATSAGINGFLYGIPSQKESASLSGVVMRKDIVDALEIDVDAIKTLDDLTEVYATVKAAYPAMDMIAGTEMVRRWENYDSLGDRFGVLMYGSENPTEVVNWFETEDYRNKAQRVWDWYQAGYVKIDAATTQETETSLVKAGTLFSFFNPIKPGYLAQTNALCGYEMTYAYIHNDDGSVLNTLGSYNVNFFNWGIATNAKDPVKAMQFLNFAYSSAEFNNLLNWGIEGEHYVKVEGSEKLIDFPAGIDANNATYHRNQGWHYPNQFLGYVWNGQDEDIWDQYQAFNDSATKSPAFGFMYDGSSLATEIAALTSVHQEYYRAIETGSVPDVDQAIADFNEKLYGAGLQKVIDLKQEQLDAWLAAQ